LLHLSTTAKETKANAATLRQTCCHTTLRNWNVAYILWDKVYL